MSEKVKENWSPGDTVDADDINAHGSELNDARVVDVTLGETIAGATTPVPAFRKYSDGEYYACDGNDNTKAAFRGFVVTSAGDGQAAVLIQHGIVGGFSGLTAGDKYFVSDSVGAVANTPGTNYIPVGVAVSTTEIRIVHEDILVSGSLTSRSGGGSDQTFDDVIVLNERPKSIYWAGNFTGTAWSTSWDTNARILEVQGKYSLSGPGHEGTGDGYFDVGIGVSIGGGIQAWSQDGFTFRITIDAGPSGGGSAAFGSGSYVATLNPFA